MRLFFLIILFLITAGGNLYAEEQGKFSSAKTCKKCHPAIYKEWESSMHSKSSQANNPLFAAIFRKSVSDTAGKSGGYCVRCHAPAAFNTGDYDMKGDVGKEGVTCDVCHTAVELTKEAAHWPLVFGENGTKLGRKGKGKSAFHKVAESKLIKDGKLCEGCHGGMIDIPGLSGCAGLFLCDQFGEMKGSRFEAEGAKCLDCHKGHTFKGAYDEENLKIAASLAMSVNKSGESIMVNISVKNSGAAHLFPSGPPPRMAFVKVSALDAGGKEVWTNFKENPSKEDPYAVFNIVFANASGESPAFPWMAAKIFKDTRIKPDETRNLVYKIPSSGVAKVSVKLMYRLAPAQMVTDFGISDGKIEKTYVIGDSYLIIQ